MGDRGYALVVGEGRKKGGGAGGRKGGKEGRRREGRKKEREGMKDGEGGVKVRGKNTLFEQ